MSEMATIKHSTSLRSKVVDNDILCICHVYQQLAVNWLISNWNKNCILQQMTNLNIINIYKFHHCLPLSHQDSSMEALFDSG